MSKGASLFVLAGAIAAFAGIANAADYRPPPEQPSAKFRKGEAALVAAHCSTCHSLDYISTQPPRMGQAFWAEELQKMIGVYGAPIPAESARTIAAYLAASR